MKFNKFLMFAISSLIINSNVQAMQWLHEDDPNVYSDIESNATSRDLRDNLRNNIMEMERDLRNNVERLENNTNDQVFLPMFTDMLPNHPPVMLFPFAQPTTILDLLVKIRDSQCTMQQNLDKISNELKQTRRFIMNESSNNVSMSHEHPNTNMKIVQNNRITICGKVINNDNQWKLIEGKKKRQRKPK